MNDCAVSCHESRKFAFLWDLKGYTSCSGKLSCFYDATGFKRITKVTDCPIVLIIITWEYHLLVISNASCVGALVMYLSRFAGR